MRIWNVSNQINKVFSEIKIKKKVQPTTRKVHLTGSWVVFYFRLGYVEFVTGSVK